MEFEWDQSKSNKNFRERGFGFDLAVLIFEGPVLEQVDDRKDYGEIRMKAIGKTAGLFFTVIYTDRSDIRRIISVRKANRKVREAWQSFVSP